MEYKVAELRNLLNSNPEVSGIISYKNKIKDDIVDVDDATVKGTLDYDNLTETFIFHLNIHTSVTGLCAVTLEPVKVLIDFNTDLFYTFKVTDDDSFEITNNIVKLDEEVWGEIVLHMPLRFLKEGAEYSEKDNVSFDKESPFAKLAKE